jgi:hypothetical protein
MQATKAAITLTREQVAEIVNAIKFQHDKSLETMRPLFDPEAVTVAAWEVRPAMHPCIAL